MSSYTCPPTPTICCQLCHMYTRLSPPDIIDYIKKGAGRIGEGWWGGIPHPHLGNKFTVALSVKSPLTVCASILDLVRVASVLNYSIIQLTILEPIYIVYSIVGLLILTPSTCLHLFQKSP